ncbi:MAG: ABC transporter permease [Acidobacteria bacterium]|nr:ABC transporter permease [Acidobacteriota bacterium]
MRIGRWFHTLPLRLRSLFRRNRVEQELDEEMRYHLNRQIETNIAQGLTREEARYAALRRMGGIEQRKEECRDRRRVNFIDDLVQDLRYALRQLRQSPTFAVVAVLILALGIGANTSIFSLIDAVLLKKLPVQDPDRLYVLGAGVYGFSYPGYELVRDENQVFSQTFTFSSDMYNVAANGPPEFTAVELVTGNYFSALGVGVRMGRPIVEGDRSPVAVISDSYWKETFARDRAAIGSSITINRASFTIIGVAPPEFFGVSVGSAPKMWIPMLTLPLLRAGDTSLSDAGTTWLSAMARLKPGITEEQARANLEVILPALRQKMGIKENARPGLRQLELLPGAAGMSRLREQYALALRILMAVVGAFLLIACANLANLLLSRGASRRREMAIRLAIGAARPRLVRQLLTESLLLAVLGGLLGLAFGVWSNRLLAAFVANGGLPLALDLRTLAFSAVLCFLTGVLFAVAPALRTTRLNLSPQLKEGARTLAVARQRLGKILIVSQVALSLLLLTGAGLFIGTLHNLKTSGLGFDPTNTLVMTIEPAIAGYKDSALLLLYQDVLDRVQSIPGVRSASISRFGLIGGGYSSTIPSVPGYVPPPNDQQMATNRIGPANQVARNVVGPKFFEAAGIPFVSGRDFGQADTASAPRAVIVNSKFARKYFGNENAIGKTFGFRPPPAPQLEIVGVVQDSKFFRLRNDSPPTVFEPFLQASAAGPGLGRMFLTIRTFRDPASVVGAVRSQLYSIATNMPVHDVRTQDEQLNATLVRERLLATLSGFFSVLAMFLASVGLYGVMSHSVAQRTNEIGVRLALGAERRNVVRLVMRDALGMVLVGVVAGLGVSLGLTRFIATMLFGLEPNDPATIGLAIALMITVAALAGYLPARRAAAVDPMAALRHE